MSPLEQTRCPQCQVPNEPGALFCSRCGASLNRPGYQGSHRKRITAASVTMAFALLLALGITALILFLIIYQVIRPEEEVDPYLGVPGTTATLLNATSDGGTTEPGSASGGAILIRPRAADASSIRKASNTTDYRPANLLDGDPATAWTEGAEGPGVGEWVRLEFSRPLALGRIEIANGYQQDLERFRANGRVKTLELEYSDGTTQLVDLVDAQGLQVIDPAVSKTEWIKFTIISVYPSRTWDDTGLSEVRVYEAVGQL
jgi:hypothetical protein